MVSLLASLKNKHLPIQYQIIERKEPKVIYLHGDRIYDYYDWLKDDSERKDKIMEIEEYTLHKYIKMNTPNNDWQKVRKIFDKPIDYELFSDVQYHNWFIFYRYQNFSKSIYKPIFKRVKSLKDRRPVIVFDSNKIDGSVMKHTYSPDGRYCAFTIDDGDPHSYTITVIDVESGDLCGKSLYLTKVKEVAWSGDSEGFFVYYDPKDGKCPNLYYHFVDDYYADIFVAKISRSEIHRVSIRVSDDFKYLILCDSQMVSVANIESLDNIIFKEVFYLSSDIFYNYVGNDGENFLFLTNEDAPKHCIIEIDIGDDDSIESSEFYEIVVPENFDKHGVLTTAFKHSVYLFLVYIENVQSAIYLYFINKRKIDYKIQLENEKFLSMSIDKIGFFFETQSFKVPRSIYRLYFYQLEYRTPTANDFSIVKPIHWKESWIPNCTDIELDVQRDSYISFDGVKVPMTIIQKKRGANFKKPCLVFAYGGFGCPMLPLFKLLFLLFMELFNGVVVIFHIRGGGELGDRWLLKPWDTDKCFEDLIEGVEHLKRKRKYNFIDKNKIAFHGASHGGLLGSVVVNRRPDLFKALTIQNANLDLINDLPMKGYIWESQYGDLRKLEYYNYIKRYAPLLYIRKPAKLEESYPPTLIVATREDPTVAKENSLKYLAHRREKALNTGSPTDKIVLLKLMRSGGHHYETAEKREYIDTVFVELQFLAESMNLRFDQKYIDYKL